MWRRDWLRATAVEFTTGCKGTLTSRSEIWLGRGVNSRETRAVEIPRGLDYGSGHRPTMK